VKESAYFQRPSIQKNTIKKNKKYFLRNKTVQKLEEVQASFLQKLYTCLDQHSKHFEYLL